MSNFRSWGLLTPGVLLVTALMGCAHATQSVQPAPAGQAASPDQQIAEKFLRDFDAAIANKDVEAYSRLLADDVSNHVTATQQGGAPQEVTATKSQMVQALAQLNMLMSDYQIERRDIKATRKDNGYLVVKDSSTEHMTLANMRVTTESRESITLVVDGDVVMAKAFDSSSSIQMAPAGSR